MKNLSDYINESIENNKSVEIDESAKIDLKDISKKLKNGFTQGWLIHDGVSYGISEENASLLYTDGKEVTSKDIQKIIDEFKAEGGKFKYKTDAEWKKAGFKDPLKD